jgi:uncharacterized protein YcaQ
VLERRRAKVLFGFDYTWEIYKRPELVQFGRYTMPILFGDHFAGRIDLRTDRRSKTLVVNGVWADDPAIVRSGEFRDALVGGLRRLSTLLGTDRVDAAAVTDARVRRAISSLNPSRRTTRN